MNLTDKIKSYGSNRVLLQGFDAVNYNKLVVDSEEVTKSLIDAGFSKGEVIAIFCPPSYFFLEAVVAGWTAGGILLPLDTNHPIDMIDYYLSDSKASVIFTTFELADKVQELKGSNRANVIYLDKPRDEIQASISFPRVTAKDPALILYTSGTTSKPKGVLHTHKSVTAQLESLRQAWKWKSSDFILSFLPLHHTHGLINVVLSALWNGAGLEFMSFEPGKIWERLHRGDVTLFMAVPTMYHKLADYWDALPPSILNYYSSKKLSPRLMISGSAALNASMFKRWKQVTGFQILERYGMTEIGMALGIPLDGKRRPGFVGMPMPSVKVRLRDEQGNLVDEEGIPGEVEVAGPTVFSEYLYRPEATQDAFTEDGWFRTGDVAEVLDGYYRILGRNSQDIIKSGGFKLSALEIESAVLETGMVKECAVIGIPDEIMGEQVGILYVASMPKKAIIDKLKLTLPKYKIPRVWKKTKELPRNTMGKVTKVIVRERF